MPEKPQIVYFLSDLQSGGTEWFALNLARGLSEGQDYNQAFWATAKTGELLPLIEGRFPLTDLNGCGYGLKSVIMAFPALVMQLRKTKPQMMISGLPLLNAAAAMAVKLTGRKTKLIVVEHIRLCSLKRKYCLKDKLKRALVRLTHHGADQVVFVSQTVARDAGYDPLKLPEGMAVLYNPVVPNDIDKLSTFAVPHPWVSAEHGPLIVSIGRLLAVKDHPLLLQAFALVAAEEPTAKLMIIGGGEEKEALKKRIREMKLDDKALLWGPANNVYPFLKAARLFVLASRSEAFGNVLIEALACGTPVISTDCGGPREILEKGDFGRLVPVGDAEALAAAMLEELKTERDASALVAYGKSFSIPAAAKAYDQLIKKLLGASA